ncbi:hypothetical protein HDF17_002051 [Granulicella arctica]|uniref:Uncharacterized protein n=1 Tax=Granulicella arctica TaxID=940613 RepID=A0A7Y9PIF5_9BACT|nr:hypothetical protein [Granulicella arctica]
MDGLGLIFPQGLKPRFSQLFAARLKPCPFKTLFFDSSF